MRNGARIVLGTAVTGVATSVMALSVVFGVLSLMVFVHRQDLNALSSILLALAVAGFATACVFGAWTLVDVARGRVEAANRRRWPATWALLIAVAIWILASATG